ncbi:dTDP-4-dehydrorhamnose reductase [Altererythrobacter sp. MTPC7]|uniref:dTDP-4-dehydrorhamnose reductase n=1 Tax=Altererythrobacter sp. MTPC7 TaxID=3056567 RepID=UPI0036F34A02
MTVLVFGTSGQVGIELAALENVRSLSRAQADLSDPEACAQAIRAADCTAVINAAAYTAVDKAEEDEATAIVVNADAPAAMARAAAEKGVPFVHISTDYVFGGAGDAPFRPSDSTGPLGAYGRTKLAGEDAVRSAGGVHAILRTSWVFSAHGNNFVKTMLRLAESRDHLTVVGDQHGGPTPARAIAEACHAIAHQLADAPEKSGTYHFSGAPDTTWAGFARAVFEEAGEAVSVEDIPTSAYPTPAARPLNSRMDCSATEAAFGIARPDWRSDLAQVIAQLRS